MTLLDQDLNRFQNKIRVVPGRCHEWDAGLDTYGYGKIKIGGKTLKAHRLAYELNKGAIPTGLMIRHMCFNRKCVNPAHLEVGTALDNARDTVRSGRQVHARGSKDGQSKLVECQIYEIRESPLPAPSLAKIYGVSPTQINRIRRRERWAHLA